MKNFIPLVGDGIADDTAAIQQRIDANRALRQHVQDSLNHASNHLIMNMTVLLNAVQPHRLALIERRTKRRLIPIPPGALVALNPRLLR